MKIKYASFLICLVTFLVSACYTSKIYVVRHAERLDQSDDTPLSVAGLKRAQILSETLRNKNIDSIFVSKYQRNRQTAQPLVDLLGKQYVIYEPKPVNIIVNRAKAMKGKNALIVGHSDTVLEIVKGFGVVPSKSKIESSDYDNLFIITKKKTLFGTQKTLEELAYGEKD